MSCLLPPQTERTTYEQVLSCLEDINTTPRFGDYTIDPAALRPNLVEGYQPRFQERYVDPDAVTGNPLPDWMATALFRLFSSVLDYAYRCHADRVMPQIACWDLSMHAYAELQQHGVRLFTGPYMPEYESQVMVIESKHGLLWCPFEIVKNWADESALAISEAALMASPL